MGTDGAASRWPGPTVSDTAHIGAMCTPNGATSPPTTTRVASNTVPAGSTTAKEAHGEGSHFQPPTGKTAPMGGTSSQDHGRSNTRGWGGSSRSVSHPRGVQEKVSVQPPCQEGDLPSGSMPSVPPPVAPEGTQPQRGGWPRSTLRDPM